MRDFKRSGRPKNNWMEDKLNLSFRQYKHLSEEPFDEEEKYDENNHKHVELVKSVAELRLSSVKKQSRRNMQPHQQGGVTGPID